MIELNIPGRGTLRLEHLVCDVNGTLAVDGQLQEGIARAINLLRDRLDVHLITADTHGRQAEIDRQLSLTAERLQPGNEAEQKEAFVCRLGAERVAAVGQGANDAGHAESCRPRDLHSLERRHRHRHYACIRSCCSRHFHRAGAAR